MTRQGRGAGEQLRLTVAAPRDPSPGPPRRDGWAWRPPSFIGFSAAFVVNGGARSLLSAMMWATARSIGNCEKAQCLTRVPAPQVTWVGRRAWGVHTISGTVMAPSSSPVHLWGECIVQGYLCSNLGRLQWTHCTRSQYSQPLIWILADTSGHVVHGTRDR
jgi:hypothetical protein